jgi:hypothetical protein
MVDGTPVIEAMSSLVPGARLPILHSMMGTLPQKQIWFAAIERTGVPMFNNAEEMVTAAGILSQRSQMF